MNYLFLQIIDSSTNIDATTCKSCLDSLIIVNSKLAVVEGVKANQGAFFIKILIATILGGALGGVINEYLISREEKKNIANLKLYQQALLGIGSAMLIPIFLAAAKSTYWMDLSQNDSRGFIVYSAFCVLAGLFARKFITKMGKSLSLNEKIEIHGEQIEALKILQVQSGGLHGNASDTNTSNFSAGPAKAAKSRLILTDSFETDIKSIEITSLPEWEKVIVKIKSSVKSPFNSLSYINKDRHIEIAKYNNVVTINRIIKRPYREILIIDSDEYILKID